MKTKLLLLLVLLLATSISSLAFQEPQDYKVLFEKAKYTMETKADLQEAITLFESLITSYPDEKEYVAKSLLYQGLCYERLGNQEAVSKYQRLVKNYPGQKQEVALAEERLSILVQVADKVAKAPLIPKFTKINIPTKLSWYVELSPDGKELALFSDKKLWKLPLSGNLGPGFSGTPVHINTEGIVVDHQAGLSWSDDGKWIAFNELLLNDTLLQKKGFQSIYVVPSEGGKPTKVIENFRAGRIENYWLSLSPDGKTIAHSSIENKEQHIYTTPVNGGSPKQLVDIQAREPAFSPDGNWIAFVEDKKFGTGGGGLWIVPAIGGEPKLIANAGYATSPVWSPDNSMIAFVDDDKKTRINIVEIPEEGKEPGNVISIDTPEGTEEVDLLAGWTSNNKIGAKINKEVEFAIYSLPVQGGLATVVLNDCWAMQPRWSPDGSRIYYATSRIKGSQRAFKLTLASVPSNGGIGTLFAKNKEGKNVWQLGNQGGNRISPDGKTIISAAWDEFLRDINFPDVHIWKITTDGSKSEKITNKEGYVDFSPSWSPDGNNIAFTRAKLKRTSSGILDTIYITTINSSGGEEKILATISDRFIFSLAWSPDGKMLAYLSKEKDSPHTSYMNFINAENGTSMLKWEVTSADTDIELAWAPDSRRVTFNDGEGKVIKIMNIDDGTIEDIITNLEDVKIGHIDWSPDGKKFVFAGTKGGEAEFWWVENFLPLDKLAQNNAAEVTPKVMTNKKIWNEPDTELEGAPSPDGKYLSYVDWETGDLAIYEIATGKKRRLTNKGSWDESNEFALRSRWSPDGKQIVYDWKNGNDFCELRIIGLDGSKPRILYSNKEVKWTYTYDWSPDGKQILAYFDRKNGTDWIGQIVLISIADGSERVLKTTPITESGATGPENMCFSPDGRYIVYDFLQKSDSPERDIFLLSSDGFSEISLVEHPAHDELLGWAPDGKNIIFASDRNGTFSLWNMQISEGLPQGNPELLKSDMGGIEPLGFTRGGSFYYGYSQKNNNIYNAVLDPETGEILALPKKTITRFEGYNQTPSYSPDGKYLAYISRRFPLTVFPDYSAAKIGGNVLCIKSLENGQEREIFPDFKFRSPYWSSDGRSVFVIDMNNSGSKQIDIQTGNVTQVLHDDNIGPQPTERSHDGKSIYYVLDDKKAKIHKIVVRNLESGSEKEIYRSDCGLHIRLSPDGKWIAIQDSYMESSLGMTKKTPSLLIIPSAGGEPQELIRFEEGIDIFAGAPFTWTPDGKYILYSIKSEKKENEKWDLYRIPANGGTPEKPGMEMSGFITNLSIHPNGRNIAFSITEQSNAEIWVMENFLPEAENK